MTSKHLFFSPLTIDAFLITKHYFDFTLAYPRNVKVQFKYGATASTSMSS